MNLQRIASHVSKIKSLHIKLAVSVLASALSFNAMADYQVEDSEGVKTLEAQPVRVA
ncbi:iron-siderophore ABC transporter substrate-binding protein, partial [Vibrio sp. 10N.222.51.A6]